MAFLEYQPKSVLFHYTNELGFEGITGTGTIWLTDLQYANDPRELQLTDTIGQSIDILLNHCIDSELIETYLYLRNRINTLKKIFWIVFI